MSHLDPSYLRYIYDGLEKGNLHPDNAAALPEGLIGLYEDAFDESKPVLERQKILETFAIWALLKKEVSAQFVAEILNVHTQEIIDFIATYSSWFVSPENGKYQLYHERLKVYLLQKLSEGELSKLTKGIFKRLKIYFDSNLGNEFYEYAQFYFFDYYNIVVSLTENLEINCELHKSYFLDIQKDATKLFYLENGRNHRERHLRQACVYFSRKKDLKILANLVHEINQFQNIKRTPLELSELIWSSNSNEQMYGYNLCSRQEDKLFVLVYSSLYHKDLNFSGWHLNVIKEYWKDLKPTKKIYDLPSLFLLDLVPFLVRLNLLLYDELDTKKLDFRFIYSLFPYRSFEFFDNQEFNDAEFIENISTSKVDILYYFELQERIANKKYFKKIQNLDRLDYNKFCFLIDPSKYFPVIPTSLPNIIDFLQLSYSLQECNKSIGLEIADYKFIMLGDLWNDKYESPLTKEIINSSVDHIVIIFNETSFSDIFYNKCFNRRIGELIIVYFGINQIKKNKIEKLIEKLQTLKIDIKFGYTRDSDGSKLTWDDAFGFNELLYSIFGYCLFTKQLTIENSQLLSGLVIKDDEWFSKYFKPLNDWQKFMSTANSKFNYSLLDEIESDRVIGMICNYFYKEKKIENSLKVLSRFFSKNECVNNIYYELNFVDYYNMILKNENILVDYYNKTNDIKQSVIPAIKYGIRTKNNPLIWNFIHVNQSNMQKFGPGRSFAWYATSALILLEYGKFISVFNGFLMPCLESVNNLSFRIEWKTSILSNFIEPVESVDLIELLNCLSKYFDSSYIAKYENLIFEKEINNLENLKNLNFLKNGYLNDLDNSWNNSNLKVELDNQIVELNKEKFFINDYNHHILLLNLYFDHPEYINSIAFYSELYKKYQLNPKKLTGKTRCVSNLLIEQLKCKDNIVPLEVSPSNLMYSYFILGQGYFEVEDFKNAIKCFKKSIENREVYSGIILGKCFLELGKSYYYVNNFRMAIENLNVARIKLPKLKDDLNDLSDCYYFLGLSYEENKKWNDSISNYIKCKNIDNRKLEKDHKDHLTVLKSILRISKHLDEKYHIKYINALIINLKSDSQLNNHEIGYYYLTIARKYRENEDFNSELKSLRKCVKHLNSSNYRTNESRIKIHFLLAKSYEKNMHFLKAFKTVKNIENEIANIITENDINSMIARCAFKAKKFKLSLEYYLKIDDDDSNPLISFKIAYCHEQINSVNKAFHYYMNYLEKKSEDDMFLNLFKEIGDEDFIDFSEYELIKALDFIESHSSKKSKIDNWIQKLIELKNANY